MIGHGDQVEGVNAEQDPLLTAITQARIARDRADEGLRLLLAYAREVVAPRPYTLSDLAEAAGLSISGVRVAYGPADVAKARTLVDPGCAGQREVERA